MNGERRDFTITQLERDGEGFWRARVTAGGRSVAVDRRWGSWQAEVRTATGARTFVRRDVLPRVARELQAKVRPLERRERIEADEAAKRASATLASSPSNTNER